TGEGARRAQGETRSGPGEGKSNRAHWSLLRSLKSPAPSPRWKATTRNSRRLTKPPGCRKIRTPPLDSFSGRITRRRQHGSTTSQKDCRNLVEADPRSSTLEVAFSWSGLHVRK